MMLHVYTPEQAFQAAIAAAGLTQPDTIIADGKIHRFATNDKPGWYIYHGGNIPMGQFGYWREGCAETWCSIERTARSEEERKEFARLLKSMQNVGQKAKRAEDAAAAGERQLDAETPVSTGPTESAQPDPTTTVANDAVTPANNPTHTHLAGEPEQEIGALVVKLEAARKTEADHLTAMPTNDLTVSDTVPALGKAILLTPDKAAAQRYLTLLDELADEFTFQTFDDNKERKVKDGDLARIFNGTLDQHYNQLVELNQRGAGVFVTVNQTDLKGRKLGNMIRPRCVFQEADRPNTPPPSLDPHIEVESSPGKFHRYWSINKATAPTFDAWVEVMECMVMDFGSDPNARDCSRVLRVPGFYHQKNPSRPHMVRMTSCTQTSPYTWDEITAVIKPLARKEVDRSAVLAQQGRGIQAPLQLRSALFAINPDCEYLDWVRIGMALHNVTGGSGEGFALWDEWSATGSSYRDGETEYKWASFGNYKNTPVMLGTVFFLARAAGWEWEEARIELIEVARAELQRVLSALVTNPKAHLTPITTEALSIIKAYDPNEYEAARTDIKIANKAVRVGELDKLVDRHDEGVMQNSFAAQLTALAAKHCEMWHDKDGNPYASLDRKTSADASHRENWRIDSTGFREWLGWLAYTELKATPASDVIKTCLNALAGIAKFDGKEYAPALRVAKDESGYWIDRCDEGWSAILITATGWGIMSSPTIRFIRTKAMRPLPVPVVGGDLKPLWRLSNVPAEDQPLVLAWILECYRCDTPYPLLELIGEAGTAKSTTQKTLRTFIDPNKVMLRGKPKNVEDAYVAAGTNHLISYENLSGLTADLSDALCTISTGGGQAGRQYYTNTEEYTIETHNPVIVNGIGAIVTRADLLDRAIALCLTTIRARMTEKEHDSALTEAAPGIFGGLLDLFGKALAILPTVNIPPEQRPRMADFAQLGEAIVLATGGKAGEFLTLYTQHRRDAIRRTVDSSPVAVACMEFVAKGLSHSGTVKQLLEALNRFSVATERGDYWPKSPRGLGDSLRRVAPALRQVGIQVSVDAKAKNDGVHCVLCKAVTSVTPSSSPGPETSSQCSPSSPTAEIHAGREEIRL